MTILETQVTELLTSELGRAPTTAELENGLISPWTLSQIHNGLNVVQSIFSIVPGDDVQAAIDKLSANGGGTLYLSGGTYHLSSDLNVPNNIHVVGVGSLGSVIDFGGGAYSIKCVGTDVYTTGTIAATQNDTAIVGTGTAWDSSMEGLQMFTFEDGNWHVIDTVTDATHIVLADNYIGPTDSGLSYVIASPNTSVFLQGFTVQNSSTDLIRVQYFFNFGGNDVASSTGASGLNISYGSIFNWLVGFIDSCDEGHLIQNVSGFTVDNTFVSNISAGAAYDCDRTSNAVITDSASDTCVGNGIVLNDSSNFSLDQFSVINTTGIGVLFSGETIAVAVSGGFIDNSSSDGFKIQDTSSQNQISLTTFTNSGGFGMNIAAVGCDSNLVIGNFFGTNSSGNLTDSGTSTLVRSNIGVADN